MICVQRTLFLLFAAILSFANAWSVNCTINVATFTRQIETFDPSQFSYVIICVSFTAFCIGICEFL